MINTCRFCNGPFHGKTLLRFENMPAMAQNFPDKRALSQDKGQDLNVRQCSSCGLIQLDCDPVPYYKEVIRAAAFSEEMRGFRLNQFSNFVKKYDLNGKKILEVGCGKGEYLSLMEEQGVQAFGLEGGSGPYPENIIQGFIDNELYQVENNPFDAFFILNYLEHLPDLNASLRGIANNLKEGGIGLVEVPNFDMIVRTGLFSEFISDHLYYFTKKTLTQVLEHNGFDVLECHEVWHDYSLSATVRKRIPDDLSSLSNRQVHIQKSVDNFINKFPQRQVAIWGAGHQALANLSLLGLQNRIAYVLDSAPFKQNKYTPATHLPIVPPATLKDTPVAGVIIMAASYSDEVARIIRKEYDPTLKVAILRDDGLEEI